jgi:hypothetical protein
MKGMFAWHEKVMDQYLALETGKEPGLEQQRREQLLAP